MKGTPALTYNSAARLDGSAYAIPCARAAIAAQLAPFGIGLAPRASEPDLHPLCIELWQLRDGGFEALGLSQRQWFERTFATSAAISGGLAGALLGAGWHALRGFTGRPSDMFGYWRDGAASAVSVAASGHRLGAALGRGVSDAAGQAFGTYGEVLVSVPDVLLGGETVRFVVCMLTNNPVAMWGDRWLGCGYRKRRATIRASSPDRVDVVEPAGLTLSCRIDAGAGSALVPGAPELREFQRWFSQPLLGVPAPGRFALTWLERELDAADAKVWSAPAQLHVGAGSQLAALVGDGHWVPSLTADAAWGALHMKNVPVRLSNPRQMGSGL